MKFPTATYVPPPGTCCPHSQLVLCSSNHVHQIQASPTTLPWPKSYGEAPGVPGAPIPSHLATVGLFALGLQLCSCCSRMGFAKECRMGP